MVEGLINISLGFQLEDLQLKHPLPGAVILIMALAMY
jgi:hypothetical protein